MCVHVFVCDCAYLPDAVYMYIVRDLYMSVVYEAISVCMPWCSEALLS